MADFTVITTCNDGEMRYYEITERNIARAIHQAKQNDADDYPAKLSDWNNYCVLRGHNLALLQH